MTKEPQTTKREIDWGALYALRDHLAKRMLWAEHNTLEQWLYNNDPTPAHDNFKEQADD